MLNREGRFILKELRLTLVAFTLILHGNIRANRKPLPSSLLVSIHVKNSHCYSRVKNVPDVMTGGGKKTSTITDFQQLSFSD